MRLVSEVAIFIAQLGLPRMKAAKPASQIMRFFLLFGGHAPENTPVFFFRHTLMRNASPYAAGKSGWLATAVRVLKGCASVSRNVDRVLMGGMGCERFESFMRFSSSKRFAKLPGCTLEKSFSPNSPA